MKLVTILARELREWPEGFDDVGQADDGSLHLPGYGPHVRHTVESYTGSDDWLTAIVTREMWQAERDRIAKENTTVKPKATKDGWIRHRGGKCPVEAGVVVDYRIRGGLVFYDGDRAGERRWDHRNTHGDIMAWRPHVAEHIAPMVEEGIQAADEGKTTQIGEVKAKWQEAFEKDERIDHDAEAFIHPGYLVKPIPVQPEGPFSWRDRILSIDAERKAEEARHCAAMEALDAERAELVGKLKAEGLAMVEREHEADGCDMSNPENWKSGDWVERVSLNAPDVYTVGKKYKIVSNGGGSVDIADECGTESYCSHDYANAANKFKWHSRPTP